MHDFNRRFDKHFASTQKSIKRAWIITALFALLQFALYLAILAGIVYFIAFAVTHWIKW